jgi:hypothetical protein
MAIIGLLDEIDDVMVVVDGAEVYAVAETPLY